MASILVSPPKIKLVSRIESKEFLLRVSEKAERN